MATTAPETDGRRTAAAARRRRREAEIIAATRELFDQRGVRDAQIEDIAKAVGINRAIVYRHFTGKEELFALTLVGYLDELRGALATRPTTATDPRGPARRHHRRVRRLRRRAPRLRRLRPDADAATGPELLDEISRVARCSGSGRGISSLPGALSSGARGRRRGRRLRTSTTRPCSPTRSTPAASARSSSPGSASWSRRPPPASPRSARSRPTRSATTWSRRRSRSPLRPSVVELAAGPARPIARLERRLRLATAAQRSRIAVDALAAGGADRDHAAAGALLGEQLGQRWRRSGRRWRRTGGRPPATSR